MNKQPRFIIMAALGLIAMSAWSAEDLTRPAVAKKLPTLPAGKSAFVVSLAALPDHGLVGQKVDLYTRRMFNNSAQAPEIKKILGDVLLISCPEDNPWGASIRQATLALDAHEEKTLRKQSERPGIDLLISPRQPPQVIQKS